MPITDSSAEQPEVGTLEHERFLSLMNSMTDAVIALDESGIINLYNAAALNLLDLNVVIENKAIQDVLRVYAADNVQQDIASIVKATKTAIIRTDLSLHYSDGSHANLYLSIAPVRPGYGQIDGRGFVLVMRDITREKLLEEERDEFISVVSHELRTPIAIAEGNVSNVQMLFKKSSSDASIPKYLDEAHNQIIFLADMINDLATLSRAERDDLKSDAETVDANKLVAELWNDYLPEARSKGLKFDKVLNPTPLNVRTSSLYLHEILQNFLTNSLKYTTAGGIRISVTAIDNGATFSVSDTGIGISKNDQAKLFSKFFRSEDYRLKGTKGTGLGLYISKKLADLLHGRITLSSELNKGTTFSINVPNLDQPGGNAL
jgi:PAS domain S-box-containing protein